MTAAQLRQSILQAAVQGKLVPQNTHDEPASVLLNKIVKEKIALLKTDYPNTEEARTQLAKHVKQNVSDDLEELPPGWEWSTLLGCSLLVTDCHNKTAPYSKSGIHLIRTSNIKNGKINFNGFKYVTEEIYKKWSSRCFPEPDDIIITREAPMGEVCIIPQNAKICLGQRTMLIRMVPKTLIKEYLWYFLQSPMMMECVQDKPVGLTVKHLRVGGVETMLIPIPPLAEQQRIVAKVDELMALCDELEAAEKKLDTLESDFAEHLPKSILQTAVQGKLVPQNVHDEPASTLLERIRAEKSKLIKQGKLKKEKPLPPITEDEVPYDLPEGWAWCRLGELITLLSGRDLETNQFNEKQNGIPYITGASAIDGDRLLITRWTAEPAVVTCKGDLLISCKGTIGKIVFNTVGECHIARQIMAIRFFSQHIMNSFIKLFLDSHVFTLTTQAKSIIPGISREDILLAPCPLPPLAEQQRIVAKVDELMALCNELKTADALPIVPAQSATVIPFPAQTSAQEEPVVEEEYLIAARGDMPDTMPEDWKQAADDLFGEEGNA